MRELPCSPRYPIDNALGFAIFNKALSFFVNSQLEPF